MTAQPRSESQFAAEWVRAQRTLSAYIAASIPDFHAAEDVLQAVAAKAFEMRERFDPETSKYSTWVIGIARNEIMHWYRSTGRDRHVFGDEVIEVLTDVAVSVDDQIRNLQEALAECLSRVTGRGRQILDLRYEHNLRSREIADQLGSTENSVNVTLHRVRAALLECIREKTGIDEVLS